MTVKLNLLKVALSNQNYDLAAHALVYGMVKAKVEESKQKNGQKRRSKEQPKR